MIGLIKEKLKKYNLYKRKDILREIEVNGCKLYVEYKISANIEDRLTCLIQNNLFSIFEPSWWVRLFKHKYGTSLREEVPRKSLQICFDGGQKIECDVDQYNPKYGILKHIIFDVLSLKNLSGYRKEFFRCVK